MCELRIYEIRIYEKGFLEKTIELRPTKSNVDNFDNNYDFNGKVIAIVLRVKRFDNFMPRVMRVRLRVNFHNFFITSPCPRIVNRRVSFACVIGLIGQLGKLRELSSRV